MPSNAGMSRVYEHKRVRGIAPWNPQKKTLVLLEQVMSVLERYADYLPMTLRQIFYALVVMFDFQKTEQAYERLCEHMNRARRSGRISFDAIRDDGTTELIPVGFTGKPGFWSTIGTLAADYRLDRQMNQAAWLEVWVEASGMAPQVERVTEPLGIPIFSSGGFDSVTAKYEAAVRALEMARKRDKPTVVLHIGDYDASGLSVFDSAEDDVTQFVIDLSDGDDPIEFRRVAVTPEQIARYDLPTAPPKKKDNRGEWNDRTTQAEALNPQQLADELEDVIDPFIGRIVLAETLALEKVQRRELVQQVREIRLGESE